MKEVWLLKYSDGLPIGIFSTKEFGLHAVNHRGCKITKIEDCGNEVIIQIEDRDVACLILELWTVDKALIGGEWQVMTSELNAGR
jgi:hypothetical protein